MTNSQDSLDKIFHALAHPTRREVVERLSARPATMTELAEPFGLAMPSFLQHMRVLESAGLVKSQKQGRSRTYELDPPAFFLADNWLDVQRSQWNQRLDQLDALLTELHPEKPHE